MPTSNMPVVGMAFDSWHSDAPERYVVKAIDRGIIWARHALGDEQVVITATMWREDVLLGCIRPVLWTASEKNWPDERLGRKSIPVVCSYDGPTRCASCRKKVALYPTRAAALAAGKAHGWSRPVARRVVRKG